MPTTTNHLNDSKFKKPTTIPVSAGPNNTVNINGNSVNVSDLIKDPNYKDKTVVILAAQELQQNIKKIQDIIAINQQIQKALSSKIHASVLNADYTLNGGGASFEDYAKNLLANNPKLANDLLLTGPIPNVLPLTPTNQFSQYLDPLQIFTQNGAPIKNKIAKLDRSYSDNYYYLDYPTYKLIEAFHQTYLSNTTASPYVDLAFINELRFTGSNDNIEMNMSRIDVTNITDLNNIRSLKSIQLSGLRKIVIANLEGNVRIVRNCFEGYNLAALESIEFRNINGKVVIEADAFANTSLPNLTSITFDDITQGVVIQDRAFNTAVIQKLTDLVIVNTQNELTVGNTIFPYNLLGQLKNFVFKNNTGRVSVLDNVIKTLIKIDCYSCSRQAGYSVYDDEFNWIKGKLCAIEELTRSYSKSMLGRNDSTLSSSTSSSTYMSSSSKSSSTKTRTNYGHIITGATFVGVAGFLLFYTIRSKKDSK